MIVDTMTLRLGGAAAVIITFFMAVSLRGLLRMASWFLLLSTAAMGTIYLYQKPEVKRTVDPIIDSTVESAGVIVEVAKPRIKSFFTKQETTPDWVMRKTKDNLMNMLNTIVSFSILLEQKIVKIASRAGLVFMEKMIEVCIRTGVFLLAILIALKLFKKLWKGGLFSLL